MFAYKWLCENRLQFFTAIVKRIGQSEVDHLRAIGFNTFNPRLRWLTIGTLQSRFPFSLSEHDRTIISRCRLLETLFPRGEYPSEQQTENPQEYIQLPGQNAADMLPHGDVHDISVETAQLYGFRLHPSSSSSKLNMNARWVNREGEELKTRQLQGHVMLRLIADDVHTNKAIRGAYGSFSLAWVGTIASTDMERIQMEAQPKSYVSQLPLYDVKFYCERNDWPKVRHWVRELVAQKVLFKKDGFVEDTSFSLAGEEVDVERLRRIVGQSISSCSPFIQEILGQELVTRGILLGPSGSASLSFSERFPYLLQRLCGQGFLFNASFGGVDISQLAPVGVMSPFHHEFCRYAIHYNLPTVLCAYLDHFRLMETSSVEEEEKEDVVLGVEQGILWFDLMNTFRCGREDGWFEAGLANAALLLQKPQAPQTNIDKLHVLRQLLETDPLAGLGTMCHAPHHFTAFVQELRREEEGSAALDLTKRLEEVLKEYPTLRMALKCTDQDDLGPEYAVALNMLKALTVDQLVAFSHREEAVCSLSPRSEPLITNVSVEDERLVRHGELLSLSLEENIAAGGVKSVFDKVSDGLVTVDEVRKACFVTASNHMNDDAVISACVFLLDLCGENTYPLRCVVASCRCIQRHCPQRSYDSVSHVLLQLDEKGALANLLEDMRKVSSLGSEEFLSYYHLCRAVGGSAEIVHLRRLQEANNWLQLMDDASAAGIDSSVLLTELFAYPTRRVREHLLLAMCSTRSNTEEEKDKLTFTKIFEMDTSAECCSVVVLNTSTNTSTTEALSSTSSQSSSSSSNKDDEVSVLLRRAVEDGLPTLAVTAPTGYEEPERRSTARLLAYILGHPDVPLISLREQALAVGFDENNAAQEEARQQLFADTVVNCMLTELSLHLLRAFRLLHPTCSLIPAIHFLRAVLHGKKENLPALWNKFDSKKSPASSEDRELIQRIIREMISRRKLSTFQAKMLMQVVCQQSWWSARFGVTLKTAEVLLRCSLERSLDCEAHVLIHELLDLRAFNDAYDVAAAHQMAEERDYIALCQADMLVGNIPEVSMMGNSADFSVDLFEKASALFRLREVDASSAGNYFLRHADRSGIELRDRVRSSCL